MLRQTSHRVIAGVILIFWLIMMSLLVRREVLLPYFGPGRVMAYSETATDAWMGVYLGNQQLGVLNTQTRPETRKGDKGQLMKFWTHLSITVLSMPTEIRMSGEAWASRTKGLRNFIFEVNSAGHKLSVEAEIDKGMLKGTVHTAGEDIPLNIPVGKNLLFSSNIGTASLNVPDLEVGDEIYVDTFDPMTMSVTKARIECVGEETLSIGEESVATKILVTHLGGFASKAWVSLDDEVIRAETPYGFSLAKISHEEALASLSRDDTEDFIDTVAIRPTGQKPHRGARFMRFRVSGVEDGLELPCDQTQFSTTTGQYAVKVPDPPFLKDGTELDEAERKEHLRSDTFVQADHETIRNQARFIVGNERDPWKKAQLLYAWVYDNIEKKPVMSLPSALDVLKSREGDCNEHTVLYTALARAAGIPTRIAIGIVWSEELGGFYYHAWPEVFVGRWTWLDPTLGQPVADATHIKLLSGSIEKWTQLLPYLGRLKIEVQAVTDGPGEGSEGTQEARED